MKRAILITIGIEGLYHWKFRAMICKRYGIVIDSRWTIYPKRTQ